MAEILDKSLASAAQHLAKLRLARLVSTRYELRLAVDGPGCFVGFAACESAQAT